ncbi:MAG TPA: VOC family protein [Terriglobales bacterium]|nr:VOC family protein [Terriglobales bacterium]
MAVKAIPEGYESAVPYLSCRDANAAIDFYRRAFNATERMRMPQPDGRVGHAELEIGSARIMLADEYPEMGFLGPQSLGGTPVGIHIYVEDVDALVAQAEKAGAKVIRPPADQFYGDRNATLEDPYGHRWFFATHKEDLTPEQMKEREPKS